MQRAWTEYNSAAKDEVRRDIIPRNEHTKGSEKSAAFFAASDAIRRKTKKKEEARQRRWRAQNTEGRKKAEARIILVPRQA